MCLVDPKRISRVICAHPVEFGFRPEVNWTFCCSIFVCLDASMIPERGGEGIGATNAIPALRPAAKLPHCNVAHCLASSLSLPLSLPPPLVATFCGHFMGWTRPQETTHLLLLLASPCSASCTWATFKSGTTRRPSTMLSVASSCRNSLLIF